MAEKFYITTPIYYVNDSPHIGHAYTSLACDVLARFMRLYGCEVKFLTGTDEHGQKVAKAADAAGIKPKDFVDDVSQRFKQLCQAMNFSNDDFIRTTEERHKKSAQEFWKLIDKHGFIYKNKYSGWYSVRDEAYYMEAELVNGKAPTGADVEWVEEESYFFKLSEFGDKLLKYYEAHPEFIGPETRRNEVKSFVKQGLQDLSISRTRFDWGIPVPGDEKHVMYVWIDALANYLSAVKFGSDDKEFGKWWPASLHMVGKDILRFHAVYWPAMLMAANQPLPKKIFAHGWWTNEGEKMSKSLGNVIAPADLVKEFGLDQSRYFLLREFPFGNDGDFSRARMIAVVNSELANNIGNLVQRTLSMIQKNCNGMIPEYKNVELRDVDRELQEKVQVTKKETIQQVKEKYYNCQFQEIMFDILSISTYLNSYIDTQAPWVQKKSNPQLMEAILYYLSEGIRCIAIMLQPFMPDSSRKILIQLGYDENEVKKGTSFEKLFPEHALKPGTKLGELQPVFPRFVEEKKAAV